MSRVIVKGLPSKVTENKLRECFKKYGVITDVSLKYTKDGVFRKFAFIGFEKEESGREAIAKLNNTYVHTSKVQVEECLPFSAENKPRPWSKYAKGSSAYKRLHKDEEDENAEEASAKRAKAEVPADVKKTKEQERSRKASKQKNEDDPVTDDEVIDEKRKNIREAIMDTGRLFLRNLPYTCTVDDLMEVFRKYGEIADAQCIIDRATNRCKGFAIITFIFPDNAMSAYEALDGTIFKGRMLHILPGESKPEVDVCKDHRNGVRNGLSKFQQERAQNLKIGADGQEHVWNPLFVGTNATAETLAERLEVGKHELLTGTGDNSAAVRLALAETQLVKETHDFLQRNNVVSTDDNAAKKRSDTTIIVKNLPAGSEFEEQLRANFARFGEVKTIDFAPGGGLSAVVEMNNSVDAKRAFKLIAYSRLKGSEQPLYLEWATKTANSDPSSSAVEEETEEEKKRTKLLVRNIPFQATIQEVTNLFSAFGEIRDVRLPKKVGIRSEAAHRGFGFVEYASHADAKRASAALRLSTHLYGRRLVVEWAKQDASVDEIREKSAKKLRTKTTTKGTKKQIRDAITETHESTDDDN